MAFIWLWHLYLWHIIRILSGRKSWRSKSNICMHAGKRGGGRMGAGGCASGPWAVELVLERDMNEDVCL